MGRRNIAELSPVDAYIMANKGKTDGIFKGLLPGVP